MLQVFFGRPILSEHDRKNYATPILGEQNLETLDGLRQAVIAENERLAGVVIQARVEYAQAQERMIEALRAWELAERTHAPISFQVTLLDQWITVLERETSPDARAVARQEIRKELTA